jgi:putative acetyltransferase
LLECLIQKAKKLNFNEMFTEASISAKPFFEKHCFEVLEQVKTINSVGFVNFKTKKDLKGF